VSWRACHEGPDKFLARSEHASWGYAQRWLLEIMCITAPPGFKAALLALAQATPECHCLFEAGGHHYALSAGGSSELMEVRHAA